jgi:signal transduction histidine kinase
MRADLHAMVAAQDAAQTAFAVRYRESLAAFVASENESALHDAYLLGREALGAEYGLLDIVEAHRRCAEPCEGMPAVGGGDDAPMRFLAEALAPYAVLQGRARQATAALRRMNQLLEEEAQRIANLLHDQPASMLALIQLDLAEARRLAGDSACAPIIERVAAQLDQLHAQLRQLSHELRPPALDQLGLGPALRFLGEALAKRSGVAVSVDAKLQHPLPQAMADTAYRVIHEALANATRHAQASQIQIRLWWRGGRLHGLVRDDGVGIGPEALRRSRSGHGIGLRSMRERVRALQGRLRLSSVPGRGTQLRFSLPRQGE